MRNTGDKSAHQIAQGFLDTTGAALSARDFDRFAPCFHLPQMIRTYEGAITLTTMSDLQEVFDRVCTQYEELGVTQIARHCISAEFDGPDRVTATYMSHLLDGDRHVKEPYPCYGVMECMGEVWKITSTDYAVEPGSRLAASLLFKAYQTNRLN